VDITGSGHGMRCSYPTDLDVSFIPAPTDGRVTSRRSMKPKSQWRSHGKNVKPRSEMA
jgi:hypothetical protein